MSSSLKPYLYKLPLLDQRKEISEFCGLTCESAAKLFDDDTLKLRDIGENAVAKYPMALRFAEGFKINDKDYLVPMVTEEQSVVAGACYAAELAYRSGGIKAWVEKSETIGQVMLYGVKNREEEILKHTERLVKKANEGQKHVLAYDLKFHYPSEGIVIGYLHFDPSDAMGAAKASEMTESIADDLVEVAGAEGNVGCVVSNYSGRLTKASVKLPMDILGRETKDKKGTTISWRGREVAERVERLHAWAYHDNFRAVTHNKGIMNGVIAVANATAQDTRAIEAACSQHSIFYGGTCKPMSSWKRRYNYLEGDIELLLPVGIVGGEIDRYPKARINLQEVLKVKSANELAEIMTAVGLMQNYAALSMLATIGVRKGHGAHR